MFSSPNLDYNLLAPILIVLGGALLGVLVEGFMKRAYRANTHLVISLLSLATAFGWVIHIRGLQTLAPSL